MHSINPGLKLCRLALVGLNLLAGLGVAESCASPLSTLAEPKAGRAMHESSWDRSGMNGDAVRVNPGETVTLLDYRGAGTIQRFWATIAPRSDVAIHSQAILRMYWDDETNPSVECPIGAFFGVGFGEQADFISLPLNETSGGYNCYWPMPFHRRARWTLTNGADKPIDSFYYNIDFTAVDALPVETRHFHAQFRRENPTDPKKNYTILQVEGAGHYVGTALFMAGRSIVFLEGDEEVYIDGEETPRIRGTGTEDYFSSGWYYDKGVYSAPYHGIVIKDEKRSRISTYRWHIEDPIPFQRSIRFTIEHGTNNGLPADYSSVAYFYLAGPAPVPPPLPKDLLPSTFEPAGKTTIAGAIEAEDLRETAKISSGGTWAQDMINWNYGEKWSNRAALYWAPGEVEPTLTLEVPQAGGGARREWSACLVTGPEMGTVELAVGEKPVGGAIDLYAEDVGVRRVDLGRVVAADDGKVRVTIKVVGKNPASKGRLVAIDAFVAGLPHE